jgi:hypothetical protein
MSCTCFLFELHPGRCPAVPPESCGFIAAETERNTTKYTRGQLQTGLFFNGPRPCLSLSWEPSQVQLQPESEPRPRRRRKRLRERWRRRSLHWSRPPSPLPAPAQSPAQSPAPRTGLYHIDILDVGLELSLHPTIRIRK